MRLLVYTCVFSGYDRVFPPVVIEPEVDYVLLTDDPDVSVAGWTTQVVDPSGPRGNRRYKMIGHRLLGEHDVSIYVDGNIRVIGGMRDFAERFLATGAAIGSYRHPLRASVREEVQACMKAGKIAAGEHMLVELDAYLAEGFPDDQGLIETGVFLKNHAHPGLEPAMDFWWQLFEHYRTRDQLGLPFVMWKLGTPACIFQESFRKPNPHFGLYPHRRSDASAAYLYVRARAYDSLWARVCLRLWHARWALRRRFRKAVAE